MSFVTKMLEGNSSVFDSEQNQKYWYSMSCIQQNSIAFLVLLSPNISKQSP